VETLEDIYAARKADFEQQKAETERRETERRQKHTAARKRDFSALQRTLTGKTREADKRDHSARPGRTRRNTGACFDPFERHARILYVIKFLSEGRGYAWPGQDTMLALLRRWYGLHMSRRTLNYDLSSMEARGLIRRKRRLSWQGFKSTLYTLTKTGFRWWANLKKVFGLFKFSRVQSFAQDTVLLTQERAYSGRNGLDSQSRLAPDGAVP